MEFIVCYTYIMQMSRAWMYADKCSNEFIKGVREFLIVAEANKQNNFMCCPCRKCKNEKDYTDKKTLHGHLFRYGFKSGYNVWTKHGERGVMMEDNEEEEDDDNYPPGKLKIKRNQTMWLMMIFAGSLLMQRDNAKVKGRS